MRRLIICLCSLPIVFACTEKEIGDKSHQTEVKTGVNTNTSTKATPSFNADSCYHYVQQQIDFGPRVPNTEAHDSCAVYLTNMLKSFGAETMIQKGEVIAYTNSALSIQNIIGRFYKQRSKRIMLCAHWDSRHIADRDSDNPHGPIQGANDGASGVAVLLEIGRHLMAVDPELGVDLIFFDAEDYGTPQLTVGMTALSDMDNSWCLGSQYWAKNPPISGYKPQFGILLDMVAATNATFP